MPGFMIFDALCAASLLSIGVLAITLYFNAAARAICNERVVYDGLRRARESLIRSQPQEGVEFYRRTIDDIPLSVARVTVGSRVIQLVSAR